MLSHSTTASTLSFKYGHDRFPKTSMTMAEMGEQSTSFIQSMPVLESTPFVSCQTHLLTPFVLFSTSSVWPWSDIFSSLPVVLCITSPLFSLLPHQSTYALSLLSPPGRYKKCTFHMMSPPVISLHRGITDGYIILFTLTPLYIFCILSQKVTALFTSLGMCRWMVLKIVSSLAVAYGGCACKQLHLQNLICSQCRESNEKPLKMSVCVCVCGGG